MADFDWRIAGADADQRYDASLIGADAWTKLISELAGTGDWLKAFDDFLTQTRTKQVLPENKRCRVFISHQRQDVPYAERIAWLTNQQQIEYWLDVHDPILRLANKLALHPQVQSILIAAIIEMALLNCSHVITVQTAHAAASQWVPYEFGRVKEHITVSRQAASWFDNGIYAINSADYLRLGECHTTEKAVITWLGSLGQSGCVPGKIKPWPTKVRRPARLPN